MKYEGNNWRSTFLKSIRSKSNTEINEVLKETQLELQKIRTMFPAKGMGYPSGKQQQHFGNIEKLRRQIAMIHTILKEKELSLPKGA